MALLTKQVTKLDKKYHSINAYMIDNYDSFTFNLVQYLKEIGLENLKVIRNDEITADELIAKKPDLIVVSPGPSNPDNAGISLEIMTKAAENNIPTFGVCLGLQSMGQAFGAQIVKFDPPMHGKVSKVTHDGKGVYKNVPSPFEVTRYHSLVIKEETLSDDFEITSKTDDGCIMGIRHKKAPLESVQYHPEAVLTEHGHQLLSNFIQKNI